MDRPKGSSADEWALWLSEFQPSLPYLAVQIAEAIEDGERRGKPYRPPKVAVCGVDCFPGDALCNGYCNGQADCPPAIESNEGQSDA